LGFSQIEIEYLYLNKKHVSSSTLPQLLCLLELEKNGKLTFGKIAELCELKSDDIAKDVQWLYVNKFFKANEGIIKSTTNSKIEELKLEDEFCINKNFSISRLKIDTKPLKKITESQELEEEIILKRKKNYIIQATITRIMKSRIGQETPHNVLVELTVKQIDLFTAQPREIKEMSEKLIEKNIIKRKKDGYVYIA
jgi:hypothetical protein